MKKCFFNMHINSVNRISKQNERNKKAIFIILIIALIAIGTSFTILKNKEAAILNEKQNMTELVVSMLDISYYSHSVCQYIDGGYGDSQAADNAYYKLQSAWKNIARVEFEPVIEYLENAEPVEAYEFLIYCEKALEEYCDSAYAAFSLEEAGGNEEDLLVNDSEYMDKLQEDIYGALDIIAEKVTEYGKGGNN